ncbi:MAG: phosphate ABC transporter permease subunit PstC [Opitutaceae bacterium]|nr:phosphate ABC transporter permease subunit PstC [Opitutaceae bacterium]
MPAPSNSAPAVFPIHKARARFLGLSLDDAIRGFFGGNAIVSVVVLALITIFLFREGFGFFAQNRDNLRIYRQAGLEYVDFVRQQVDDHTALNRYLSDLRLRVFIHYREARGLDIAGANRELATFDDFAGRYSDSVEDIRGLVSDMGEVASGIKSKFLVMADRRTERAQLMAAGKTAEAAAVVIEEVDFAVELEPLLGLLSYYQELNADFVGKLREALDNAPAMPIPELQTRMDAFQELNRTFIAGFPAIEKNMARWDHDKVVPMSQSITAFLFGKQWLTASFWQDWYGMVPLLVGSVMVSIVALCLAVPLGVGAAVYVNQIATEAERKFIKPCIEFIAAIPSVVLGFFGIAVLGQLLRMLSQQAWLAWVPGFPYSERLNILTAGGLLALLAVPTIFTLAEDALNNVPRPFKEASLALGATRWQTILRIIMPASLSGIISAVLLGLGRVIGETMVVLLCAGNRIAIPDFTAGLAIFTQPVHTMTGIIAQEMGEVVHGSIHYRALFVVGIVLFFLALLINFFAQRIVQRYRVSIG